MMAVDENIITSWFQVSGIHGRPYIAWDNVNPTTPDPTAFPTGYCTHGQVLFPTWHRPYLALFEVCFPPKFSPTLANYVQQVIAGHAQTAAKAYNSAVWQKAADNLRIPFWDWAAAPQGFPDVMTWPSVRITTPTGVKNVTNPLYRYKFRSHPEQQNWFPTNGGDWDAYLGSQPWTLRWPDANNVTHDESINIRLAGDDIPAGLRQQVVSDPVTRVEQC
jgi:tyrosinase